MDRVGIYPSPDELLIIGRDVKRALGLGTFPVDDIKQMIYNHPRQ